MSEREDGIWAHMLKSGVNIVNLTLSRILCFFLAATALTTVACNIHLDDDENTVTLYTDTSFRETREQRTEHDDKCVNVPESMNDRVSSIACDGDITVYEHKDCHGDSRRFSCDVPDLHDFGWGDRSRRFDSNRQRRPRRGRLRERKASTFLPFDV